jgi:hypothetical protein
MVRAAVLLETAAHTSQRREFAVCCEAGQCAVN